MLLVGATYSCTDEWNDHYKVETLGDGTLWDVINSDSELSNFAAVLKATGYNTALDGSQVFTVFAPTNDCFTEAERDAAIQSYNEQKARGVKDLRNTVVKEFIQNHIALYNYSVSSATKDTTINMMNGKLVKFNGTSFAGNDFLSTNVATGNGVLFTIGTKATFEPNILEYLEKDAELDSLRKYLYLYNLDVFQPDQSVPGEIIDGSTHYLDSVTMIENVILEDFLGAQINNEDSSYVMLAPTNAVWDQLLTDYSKYFKYDKLVSERDSFEFNFPRLAIIRGTVFSQNENRNILTNMAIDSVMSTNAVSYSLREMLYGSFDKKYYQYDKPYDATNGIFAGTTDIACSNGVIKKANNWNVAKESTFYREIVMEGEGTTTLDSLNIANRTTNPLGDTSAPAYVNVTSDNPFYNKVSGNGYIEISSSGSKAWSNASFFIRDALSNVPYDVYLVLVPATAGDTLASDELMKQTRFRCAIQCHDENGNAYYISSDDKGNKEPVFKNNDTTLEPEEPTSKTRFNSVGVCGEKLDSVFIGTYTFPTSSYGTSEPQVKLFLSSYATSAYTKTLRLDCIVLKPHEE